MPILDVSVQTDPSIDVTFDDRSLSSSGGLTIRRVYSDSGDIEFGLCADAAGTSRISDRTENNVHGTYAYNFPPAEDGHRHLYLYMPDGYRLDGIVPVNLQGVQFYNEIFIQSELDPRLYVTQTPLFFDIPLSFSLYISIIHKVNFGFLDSGDNKLWGIDNESEFSAVGPFLSMSFDSADIPVGSDISEMAAFWFTYEYSKFHIFYLKSQELRTEYFANSEIIDISTVDGSQYATVRYNPAYIVDRFIQFFTDQVVGKTQTTLNLGLLQIS